MYNAEEEFDFSHLEIQGQTFLPTLYNDVEMQSLERRPAWLMAVSFRESTSA